MRPIASIANDLAIPPEAWAPYGRWVAKVDPSALGTPSRSERGRIVLVTGMTPTSYGVGKSVTMLGLGAALARRGTRTISCLRQPSLGPVFGIKGGGAGGGRATAEPVEEVNLGLTGDLDAVTNAHNLLASVVDNHLHHGNALGLDPQRIVWPRAFDLEDRALRDIEVGRGPGNGPVRSSGFVITPASEVTALLGLAHDLAELRTRLDRIVVGFTMSGRPVRAGDLGVGGAMAALLRHAVLPNLLQTQDGTPVLVHGGPFGNLSYGTTTLRALEVGRAVSDIVLVEAGFGTDLGGEKFVDLIGPAGDVEPSGAVLVVSLPVLRAHGAGASPGGLAAGLANLEKHVENVRTFGLEPVVAVNRFPDDTPEELAQVHRSVTELGVRAEDSFAFSKGAEGCLGLADALAASLEPARRSHPLYALDRLAAEKMETIVRVVYGGDGIELAEPAAATLASPLGQELGRAPVVLAKTPLSLSDDPKKLGRPTGFRPRVREVLPAAGAGYLVALLGDIRTMPGLPRDPRLGRIGLDASGRPEGVG